jgi:6,7-dimethyl-8-ribityllumazine synthase
MAIGNGILTVENRDQAWARANRSEKNKGADAANAALRMVELKKEFGAH